MRPMTTPRKSFSLPDKFNSNQYIPRQGDLVYEYVEVKNTGKSGVIKPDAKGCYTQIIGAIGTHSRNGVSYPDHLNRAVFENNEDLLRKLAEGKLRAEVEHPSILLTERDARGIPVITRYSEAEYLNRLRFIDSNQVCGTWVKIWLSSEKIMDESGVMFTPIMGTIYPDGPKRDILIHAYDSPHTQVSYSLRSIAATNMMATPFPIRQIIELITFDLVNDPGLACASKTRSPAMESYVFHGVSRSKLIDEVKQDIIRTRSNTGALESVMDKERFLNALENLREYETKKQTGSVSIYF